MTLEREVDFHPHPIEETQAARSWYQDRSELAGAGFVRELDRAIVAIQEAPMRWPEYVKETRRFLFRRFPFFVAYRITKQSIQIVAVAHGRRKPGYWRHR